MDVRLLEYLVIIEEERNLSRAAERIHISQSALSQNLFKIETELGAPLFLRERKRWTPTEVGRSYLAGARELIRIKKETYEKLSALSEKGSDAIRLAICPQVYTLYSGAILSAVKEAVPKLRVDFYRADSLLAKEYLLNEVVDVAILATPIGEHYLLDYHLLYRERLVLAVPDDMAWKGPEIDWNRLRHIPFVVPAKGTHMWTLMEPSLMERGLAQANTYQAEDSEGIRLLVEHGYGAALLPQRVAATCDDCRLYSWEPPVKYDVGCALSRYARGISMLKEVFSVLKECMAEGSPQN